MYLGGHLFHREPNKIMRFVGWQGGGYGRRPDAMATKKSEVVRAMPPLAPTADQKAAAKSAKQLPKQVLSALSLSFFKYIMELPIQIHPVVLYTMVLCAVVALFFIATI